MGGSWGVSGTDSNRLWSPVLGLVLLQMRLFDAGLIQHVPELGDVGGRGEELIFFSPQNLPASRPLLQLGLSGITSNYRWTFRVRRPPSHPAPAREIFQRSELTSINVFSGPGCVLGALQTFLWGYWGNKMKRGVNAFPEIENSISCSFAPSI